MRFTHRRVAVLVLGLVALALVIVLSWRTVARRRAAPPAAASRPAPATRVAAVTGRVVTPGGKPMARTEVVLVDRRNAQGRIGATAITDAAGAFHFPHVEWRHDEPPPAVAARAAGWGTVYHQAPYDGRAVDLTLPLPTELQVAFEDAAGRPLRGLKVAVQRVLIHGAGADLPVPGEWRGQWTRRTDARGVVAFAALPRGGQVRLGLEDERFAQLGRDSFIDLAEAAVTAIPPITVPAAATISGRVSFGPTGKPAAGVHVRVSDADPMGYSWGDAVTDARGRYRITQLRPATYCVVLDLEGAVAEDWTAALQSVELDEGQQARGIDFSLTHGALITGRVVAKGAGRGLPGVAIAVYGPAHPEPDFPTVAKTDADGRYRVRVPAGEQRVMLWTDPPAGYVAPEKREVKLRLREGQRRRVDFRFGGPLAAIEGRVLRPDGRPAPGAEVVILGLADPRTSGERVVKADARGEFHLPAEGVLLGARSGTAGTLGLMRVTEGGNIVLRLRPGRLGAVLGTVVDAAGSPVRGATVELSMLLGDSKRSPTGPSRRARTITTGSDGRYVFPSLWPDQWYVVSASANPNAGAVATDSTVFKLKPGERQTLVSQLGP
jgi:hypothetical protein